MIAPADLTIPLLRELLIEAEYLVQATRRAILLDRDSAGQVCEHGARIAQLLGIAANAANVASSDPLTEPPSEPLVDFDAGETMDLPAGVAEGED